MCISFVESRGVIDYGRITPAYTPISRQFVEV
jgi:hypothetical protein